MNTSPILLGVNIDHVATLRQARHTRYPDPIEAVYAAENGGADGITIHLREDRRHIQERDVRLIKEILLTRMNLEIAITPAMITFATTIQPEHCCLVPEKREELTTEGGLDVVGHFNEVKEAVAALTESGSEVSLFIDPDLHQIESAIAVKAPAIELHTGCYADAKDPDLRLLELNRLIKGAEFAAKNGLIVNAGHGLNYQNVEAIAMIPQINELNIGHAIIARALFSGLQVAVSEMKQLMLGARYT